LKQAGSGSAGKKNDYSTMKTSQRTPTGRPHRVAELLRERLALILLYKCADPRLKELTLTEVEMSPDLKQARVFYAARETVDPDQVSIALDKALGFIKQEVAREHILRLMPEFIFLPDTGLDRAAKLERLFQEAKIHKNEEKSEE
jgi:ribosome-binding factor A